MGRKSIGVDVSKKSLDVFSLISARSTQYDNTRDGIKALLKQVAHEQPEIVVLEATGAYSRELVEELRDGGLQYLVVNPKRMREFARGLGILAKNDKIDARVIAIYGEKSDELPSKAPTKEEQALKELCTRRQQLIEMMTQERNRLGQSPKFLRQSIRAIIHSLQAQVKLLNKKIEQQLHDCELFANKAEKLRAIKGIGPVATAVLLSFLPELGSLNKRQIASLVGLAPFARDSGKFRGQRTIYGGRTAVRCALYMCTLSIIRYDARFRDAYRRLLIAGKKKKVALIACARKLIISLNAMFRDNTDWIAQPS